MYCPLKRLVFKKIILYLQKRLDDNLKRNSENIKYKV